MPVARDTTPTIMRSVLIALAPGAATLVLLFGVPVLQQLLVATLAALLAEAAALTLRRRAVRETLEDHSAIVTGVLIALALPPDFPLHSTALGVVLGLWLGKHVYGGLGQNLFNPAMVGYVLLLLAEPAAIAQWPAPDGPAFDWLTERGAADAWTHATPLASADGAGRADTPGTGVWMVINGAFLAGGTLLLIRRHLDPRLPAGALLGLTATGGLIALLPGVEAVPPHAHLYLGATMLAVFFVVTDPVTAPAGSAARWLYATAIGATTAVIREIGAHPDGWAYAVLIFNAAAPLLDRGLRPRRRDAGGS